MRYILLLLLVASCGVYEHSSYNVKSVLAITEKGDTLAVPIREFERNKYNNYVRFNYNNAWYWNNWRYDLPWRQNWFYNTQFWGSPYFQWNITPVRPRNYSRPKSQPKTRPRVNNPRPRVPIKTPRGSRSYVRPNNNPNRTRNVNTPRQTQSNYNIGRTNTGRSRKNQ